METDIASHQDNLCEISYEALLFRDARNGYATH